MRDSRDLSSALTTAQPFALDFTGMAFRASHLRHFSNPATCQPLYCADGGTIGSRYVPPAGPPSIYLALDVETAYREVNKDYFRAVRTAPGRTQIRAGLIRPDPLALLGVHVRVARLLNLVRSRPNGNRTRRLLGIGVRSDTPLLGPWAGIPDTPTQLLGSAVYHHGFFEGILFPSAQRSGHACLVLFRDRLSNSSRLSVVDRMSGLTAQLP